MVLGAPEAHGGPAETPSSPPLPADPAPPPGPPGGNPESGLPDGALVRLKPIPPPGDPPGGPPGPARRGSVFFSASPTSEAIAFSPDGTKLVTAGADRAAHLWNAVTGVPLRVFARHDDKVNSVLFLSGGRHVLSAGDDGMIRCFDVSDGREVGRFDDEYQQSPVTRLLLAPGGHSLASCHRNGLILMWNVEYPRTWGPGGAGPSASVRLTFRTSFAANYRNSPVAAAAFSRDGKRLAADTAHAWITIWSLDDGREVRSIDVSRASGIHAVAFSPDGAVLLAGGGGGEISEWDVATGVSLYRASPHADAIRCVAYAPDGRFFASGSRDRSVRLWDARTARELLRRTGDASVVSMAFSPDGRRLAALAEDASAWVWDVTVETPDDGTAGEADLPRLWEDLAADGEAADLAFRRLANGVRTADAAPRRRLLAFLRTRLLPVPERIPGLIDALDHDSFAVRESAMGDLRGFGKRAEEPLRRALERAPSAEARVRIERLLAFLDPGAPEPDPPPETRRAVRAIPLLELLGTTLPEAAAVLDSLAAGDPEAPETRQAVASRERAKRRGR